MKKMILTVAFSTSLLLVACGDKDEATNVPDNAPVETNKNNTAGDTSTTVNAPFNFTHFDLDVEYPNKRTYDVEYENETAGAEAKIEDELNNKITQGNEAMNTLIPIFESLTFDHTTADAQVIDEVLQKFNLSELYFEFDLEVKFTDGTTKEYRHKKPM
ncbi:MAG: YusW family protein [Solibacillus sp.]|uniref:YusW family protein n=1 Tax=unclassified Solibacillus TaxID=2637870 RepID=UPI0030F8AD7B